jgi:hypothetical protein
MIFLTCRAIGREIAAAIIDGALNLLEEAFVPQLRDQESDILSTVYTIA